MLILNDSLIVDPKFPVSVTLKFRLATLPVPDVVTTPFGIAPKPAVFVAKVYVSVTVGEPETNPV